MDPTTASAQLDSRSSDTSDAFTGVLEWISRSIKDSEAFRRFISPSATLLRGFGEDAREAGHALHGYLPDRIASLARPGRTTFILGRPGSGKTTLWWLLTEASTRLAPPLLPVPIGVQTLALAETREGLIRQAVPVTQLSDANLAALDAQRHLLILIDGLNEIDQASGISEGARRALRAIVRGHEVNAVVATSRPPIPNSFQPSGPVGRPHDELLLLPFDEEQM